VEVFAVFTLKNQEVCRKVPHITSSVGSSCLLERYASTFEAFIHNLQKLSLLGIHVSSLEIVDPEKAIFERTDVFFQEIATLGIDASRTIGIRMIEPVNVEPRFRNLALPRTSSKEQVPQLGSRRGTSG